MKKTYRRTFLKQSSLMAAGALFLPACSNSTTETTQTASTTTSQTGLQLYTLRNPMAEDLLGTIKRVRGVGYDHVELFGYGNGEYFGMPAAEFHQLVKDNGLDIKSGHYASGITTPDRKGTLSNVWEQAVEDAVAAGQSYMVLAYLVPEERKTLEDYKKLAELLNQAGEVSKSAGIQFCYHNHDFEFQEIEGEMPMYYLLDNTDPELVKMELDLYWIVKAGLEPVAFFERYNGRVPLWHVKDMDDTPEQKFAEVGTGVMDFEAIFAAAKTSGMEAFFVEQDISEDPLKSIEVSYGYVQKLLKS